MISTATALTRAWASRGSGPKSAQARKVRTEAATTTGTNTAATRSATRWIGARERWACETSATMWASSVSAPTRSARITKLPVAFTVAPVSLLPAVFSTGIGSPVIIDSSTDEAPSSTVPSTGIFSPGRTRRRSPGFTCSSGASRSLPSGRTTRAVLGARPRRARIALPVRARARSSRTCPSRTSAVMTAAASKYTATRPCIRNDSGKTPGATVATRE